MHLHAVGTMRAAYVYEAQRATFCKRYALVEAFYVALINICRQILKF